MKNLSSFSDRLVEIVLHNSVADNWKEAVLEWVVVDCRIDERRNHSCVCGQEKLQYLYTIQNTDNSNILFPIGSSCIEKFKNKDLNKSAKIQKQLVLMKVALKEKRKIELNANFFSKDLVKYLFMEGVFAEPFKKNSEYDDYNFLLNMFNKTNKQDITEKQQSKINFLIWRFVIPYLKKQKDGQI